MHGADQLINTLLTRNHLRPLSVKIQERSFGSRSARKGRDSATAAPAKNSDQWPYEMGDDAPPPPTTTSRKPP